VEANLQSLLKLFKGSEHLVIPEFQRPYVWTLEEVEQLWNDLYEAWQEAAPVLAAGEDPEDYFLGPLVVARQKRGHGYDDAVVDGQQRLTSLQALLLIARLHMEAATVDTKEARGLLDSVLFTPAGDTLLAVARADKANFLAIREGSPVDPSRELGKNAAHLRAKLDALSVADTIAFVNFILREVSVIVVQTDSYSAAWDLFIGLNGKGKPLNAADLIKAFVCGTAGSDHTMIADIWEERVVPLGADATSALLDVTRVATGNAGSEAKLFKQFETAWRTGQITSPLLSDGAAAYRNLWLTGVEEIDGMGSATRRCVRGLRRLDRRDHSVVLLALSAVYDPLAPFDAPLVRAMESYQLWMAVRGKHGKERDFTALASRIFREKPLFNEAKRQIRELLTRLAPSRDEVVDAIRKASYPGRHMKFIANQYEEGMRGDVRVEDVQYEHLMPVTPTEYWFKAAGTTDLNEYARIVNNIGNIVPLDAATNIAGSNKDWHAKRDLYQKEVPTWLACRIGQENPDGWSPDKIRVRASAIAEWAVNYRWNLDSALKQLSDDNWRDLAPLGVRAP
jgi:hypothetical protein